MRALCYGPDSVEVIELKSAAEARGLVGRWPVVWVNVEGLGDAATLKQIADAFGIHPLAAEDIVHLHQRAKVDSYEGMLYIVARMVRQEGPYLTEQVSMCLGPQYLVTFLEDPGDVFDSVRSQLHLPGSFLRTHPTPDMLAYRLIDAAVDSYYPVLEELGERLDQLEGRLGGTPNGRFIADLHQLRAELLLMRRAVWPHRDAVNSMARDASVLVSETTRMFLRDVYDHTVHLLDHIETSRELCSDLRDQYMTAVSNRLNEIMKVLTVISTIFLPLSFIASLYGMNFNTERSPWNMPELNWRYGYPYALGLMGVIATGMLGYFYGRGWLVTTQPPLDATEGPPEPPRRG